MPKNSRKLFNIDEESKRFYPAITSKRESTNLEYVFRDIKRTITDSRNRSTRLVTHTFKTLAI